MITIGPVTLCSGGNHFAAQLTVNGQAVPFAFTREELDAAMKRIDQASHPEDVRADLLLVLAAAVSESGKSLDEAPAVLSNRSVVSGKLASASPIPNPESPIPPEPTP
jgi:hypothetical protein